MKTASASASSSKTLPKKATATAPKKPGGGAKTKGKTRKQQQEHIDRSFGWNLYTVIRVLLYGVVLALFVVGHWGVAVLVKHTQLWSRYLFWWFPRPSSGASNSAGAKDSSTGADMELMNSNNVEPEETPWVNDGDRGAQSSGIASDTGGSRNQAERATTRNTAMGEEFYKRKGKGVADE
ncbi:unnamed protein product [Amoebophrya sp. A120]|nr:unnamed protein product [Amoebophrya sp. A120]|eukprot:GSA120T00005749001.1